MTEWKYPGDDAVRRAFAANVLRIIEERGLTLEEFERRLTAVHDNLDEGFYERAFGRAVKKLREERGMTRKTLAGLVGVPCELSFRLNVVMEAIWFRCQRFARSLPL